MKGNCNTKLVALISTDLSTVQAYGFEMTGPALGVQVED